MEDGVPSVTARRVAAHRLGFSRVAAAYGVPAADDALAADVAAGLVAPANRMHDYLAARTSFFDRTVVSAIDRGVRQIVVGAAGYDGRAFRSDGRPRLARLRKLPDAAAAPASSGLGGGRTDRGRDPGDAPRPVRLHVFIAITAAR